MPVETLRLMPDEGWMIRAEIAAGPLVFVVRRMYCTDMINKFLVQQNKNAECKTSAVRYSLQCEIIFLSPIYVTLAT